MQACDDSTRRTIDVIEADQLALRLHGTPTSGNRLIKLNFQQGTFFTTRATAHSLVHVFVQIFKQQEHMLIDEFRNLRNSTILDLGANEGYYAIAMAQKRQNNRVIAIEPNPKAYELLKKNVDTNNLSMIQTLNVAAWKKSGTIKFYFLPQVTSIGSLMLLNSSYLKEVPNRVQSINVRAVTLQEIVTRFKLDKIDLLKIDIEGAELELLQSARATLEITDKIVIEYHSQAIKRDVRIFLESMGFKLKFHSLDRRDFGDLYFMR